MLHPGGSNALHPFTEYSGWEKCVSWRKPAPSVPMEKSWQVPEGLVPRGSAETMIFARRRPSGSPGAPSRRWRRSACTRAAAARRCYGTPLRHLLAGRRATGQRSPRGPVLDDETEITVYCHPLRSVNARRWARGDHFHRVCSACGHTWMERCHEDRGEREPPRVQARDTRDRFPLRGHRHLGGQE
jgi:hypothetical protein